MMNLWKFMDKFRRIVVQVCNLNPEVSLHSMLLALRPSKFTDNMCKKTLVAWTSCVSEPNATSKWKKCLGSGTRSTKPEKSAISEKEAPRPTHINRTKGLSQTRASLSPNSSSKRVTTSTVNRTTILEEAFNLEVSTNLPPTKPPRLGLDATKYYRYHRGIDHNTKD